MTVISEKSWFKTPIGRGLTILAIFATLIWNTSTMIGKSNTNDLTHDTLIARANKEILQLKSEFSSFREYLYRREIRDSINDENTKRNFKKLFKKLKIEDEE